MARPTLQDLDPDEYNAGLHYYPFIVNFYRFNGSYNIFDGPSDGIYLPNKTEDVTLIVLDMIPRINESKTLTKRKSCEFKCKFDSTKFDSDRKWNDNKCQHEYKNTIKNMLPKMIIFGILENVLVKKVNIQELLLVIQ